MPDLIALAIIFAASMIAAAILLAVARWRETRLTRSLLTTPDPATPPEETNP